MFQTADFGQLTTEPILALWQASEEPTYFHTSAMIRTCTYLFFMVVSPRRRPTGMRPGTPSLQHLHLRAAKHLCQKVCMGDDLAIMHSDGDCQAVEGVLSKGMEIVSEYLQIWKLKLSTTKTLPAVFHLNNKEGKRELNINHNSETLPFCSKSKCLDVTLDRSVTYRRHFIALLRRLAGFGWGVGGTMLRTATLALVDSTTEWCAPVWCRSAHTRLIDPAINDALRVVTGCLRSAPADNLPILAGIQPAELRHKRATLSLARHSMAPGHLLHSVLTCPPWERTVSQINTPISTGRTTTHQFN